MASAPRAPRHRVNAFQALALLMAFLLLAVLGGVLSAGLLMPAVAAIGTTSAAAQQVFDDLPTELEIQPPSEQSRLYANDGSLLATFFAENRVVVPLTQISQNMINAVIATEDKRFYQHKGIDPEGLMRAALRTLQGDKEGASTLTQQYVKNVLIEAGVTSGDDEAVEAAKEADGAEGINRKLREMKIAISLEKRFTKEQILEGYLNIAQFGISTYGVETASQYFYGHSAAEMTPAEAALVAGITKSPGRYDPTRSDDEEYTTAKNRRDTVLYSMLGEGYITQEEYNASVAIPVAEMLNITPTRVGCATAGISAYFCEYVQKVLVNDKLLGATPAEATQALLRGGLSITTTIDPVRQQQAFDSLVARVPENDSSYRQKVEGVLGISGAISTVEPGTGNIVAMVQNTTFGDATAENPRATRVNYNVDRAYGGGDGFQTGSTFKAFVLTQWLIDGKSLADTINAANNQSFPADTWNISCSPESVAGSPPYEPKNLEPGGGRMSVLRATEGSVNTAYVAMANTMDLCTLRDTTSRMGVHLGMGFVDPSKLPQGSGARSLYEAQEGADIVAIPSMALGSNTIAPLTMAAAFATYAADGVFCEPRSVTAIVDRDGNQLPVPGSECLQALEPHIAAATTYALEKVVENGTATGAQLPGDRPAAGKTGTANDDYHAWFVGYTPQLSTAVWIGHAEGNISMFNTTINGRFFSQVYGGAIPAPLWGDYMAKATEGMEVRAFTEAQEKQIQGDRQPVPNVAGMSPALAQQTLTDAGWTSVIGEERYSASVPVGAVAEQSPRGGSLILKSQVITLYLSKGPEPVPEVPTMDPGLQPPAQPGVPEQPGSQG